MYYNSSADIAINAVIPDNVLYESIESGEGEYWMNRSSSSSWTSAGLPIYIVGTINANNELILDNSTTTAFLTNALPTTEDGKIYVHVGYSDNEDDLWRLSVTHPIFEFKAGAIRRYTPALIPSEVLDAIKTVDGASSGLDADRLDGYEASTGTSPYTAAIRDGSGNLPGNISTATTLQTARTINGVSFNGSANITVEPYIEDDEGTDATRLLIFTDNTTAGFKRLNEDSGLTYNPLNNLLRSNSINASNFYVGTATTGAYITSPFTLGNLGLNAGSTAYNVYIGAGATNYAQFSNTLITHYSRLYSAPGTSQTASTPNFESRAQGSGNGVVQYHMSFTNSTGSVNGRITTNNFGTTYATTSDYRVKEDLQEMEDATSRLLQLKPINFKWVGSEDRTDGFLAHEVKEIVHDAVVGEKDATETVVEIVVDEEGNETEVTKVVDSLQALDQAKLVPLLVKTIQELEARIRVLEAK